ncbi:MAG: single-stranded DNA-binding protein [Solirubrobacterales bacterium]
MNSVTLIGTLTKDPEMRNGGETKVCSMRLAESNGRKDSSLFINVAAFGRQAETCEEYLSKGRQVAVTGQLRFREWEIEGGGKRSEHSIAADRVDFLPGGKRRDSGNGGGESGPEGL